MYFMDPSPFVKPQLFAIRFVKIRFKLRILENLFLWILMLYESRIL